MSQASSPILSQFEHAFHGSTTLQREIQNVAHFSRCQSDCGAVPPEDQVAGTEHTARESVVLYHHGDYRFDYTNEPKLELSCQSHIASLSKSPTSCLRYDRNSQLVPAVPWPPADSHLMGIELHVMSSHMIRLRHGRGNKAVPATAFLCIKGSTLSKYRYRRTEQKPIVNYLIEVDFSNPRITNKPGRL